MIRRTLTVLSILIFMVVGVTAIVTLPVWVVVYIITGTNVPYKILMRIVGWTD